MTRAMLLIALIASVCATGCGRPPGSEPLYPDQPLHRYEVRYAGGSRDTITAAAWRATSDWGHPSYTFYAGPWNEQRVVADISVPCSVVELP